MPAKNKALTIWLALILLLISLMVVVGGLTRLTHSGLSIVDWRPIMGALPPLSESDWQETFDKYKKFPEYQRRISDMTLADFKSIYWWEYSHRLLGRVIGIAFLIPWLYFWIRKRIPSGYNVKLGALFVFGALQGVLGWFMVQSGLIDNPQVSHYRLAAHLALAFLLFGATLWVILALREVPRSPASTPRIRAVTRGITALISLQVIYGALTAGLKGGYVLNTFPLMNGKLIPTGLIFTGPLSFFENVFAVQFVHRTLGWLILIAVIAFWVYLRRLPLTRLQRIGAHHLLGAAMLQFALGVLTLVLAVPPHLAATHQFGALALFAAALFVTYCLSSANSHRPDTLITADGGSD